MYGRNYSEKTTLSRIFRSLETGQLPENYDTQCLPNYTADIREGVAVEYVSCEPSENLKELFPEEYGDDDSFEEEETEQA